MHLANAIREANPGDVIVVHTDAMKEMGERAHARMCPDKDIIFRVED